MTERTPCKGTNNRGKSCGAHVPEGGEYCRWHSTDQRQAANAGARTSASAGAPDGSDGKRAVWQQLIAFAREHPAMASALVYFPLCFMGVFYEYHLLRRART